MPKKSLLFQKLECKLERTWAWGHWGHLPLPSKSNIRTPSRYTILTDFVAHCLRFWGCRSFFPGFQALESDNRVWANLRIIRAMSTSLCHVKSHISRENWPKWIVSLVRRPTIYKVCQTAISASQHPISIPSLRKVTEKAYIVVFLREGIQ
jgi:hypothetical protein